MNNNYGNNPTINQTFKIELDLPILTNNVPVLSCYVEDFFLKIFKEKLGFFEISIKDSIIETKKIFDEMQNKLEDFIKKQEEIQRAKEESAKKKEEQNRQIQQNSLNNEIEIRTEKQIELDGIIVGNKDNENKSSLSNKTNFLKIF